MGNTAETALQGRNVLVTGATGFIGTRLVEKLVLEHGANVTALVRNYGRAARIARFDLKLAGGDIRDSEAVQRAMAGIDTVFNLAYVMSNDVDENIQGIANIIDSALGNEVRRVVHTSTYSVHEPFGDRDIDAGTPPGPGFHEYATAKIAVEQQIAQATTEAQFPGVVIRPSIVYGPFGGYWTDRPARNLIRGRVVLPDNGQGLCNGVFIDDLVDGLILGATRDEAVGQTFLISGPAPVTWKEFYETFESHLGISTLRLVEVSAGDVEGGNRPSGTGSPQPSAMKSAKRSLRRAASKAAQGLSREQKRRVLRLLRKTGLLNRKPGISDEYDYASRHRCHIDKAVDLLGYEPRFDFKDGMEVTGAYLRWAYPSYPNDLSAWPDSSGD